MNESDGAKATVRKIFEAMDAGNLHVLDDHPCYRQTREFMPRLKKGVSRPSALDPGANRGG